ncbi:MAG: four-carbon acid sugar kinase family protein [Caldilineaceae bacterium]
MQLSIIADDLTGAADCAARCHTAGLSATIRVNCEASTQVGEQKADVLSVNFDSRHLPPVAAAERVQQGLSAMLDPTQPAIWYKKIDSTLRGNIGAELAAMLPLITPVGKRPCAVISPAFPAQQRGLQHGSLVYELSNAPRHLPSMLAEQTTLPIALIELADVRLGRKHLADLLCQHYAAGAQLLVIDGISDDDLTAIVTATRQALPDALLCGSAGMILPLAAICQQDLQYQSKHVEQTRSTNNSAMIIVGSASEMAHRQIATVERQQAAQIVTMRPDMTDAELASWARIEKEANLLLHLPKPDRTIAVEGQIARQMANLLVSAAYRLIEQRQPQTLILVGGDTAQLTMAQLGIQQLDVIDECQPGMPLSVGVDAQGTARQFILKAGNHGDEESLLKLITYVTR